MKKTGNDMVLRIFIGFFLFVSVPGTVFSEPVLEGRNLVVLEGKKACMKCDLSGGSLVDFHLIGEGLNPLAFNYPEKGDTEPRKMGHFLCFDRWAVPTAGEKESGMPFQGEAAQVEWNVHSAPAEIDGGVQAVVDCALPLAGMTLKRTMVMSGSSPVVTVREEISNVNPLGRIFNIVQHATLSPPFVDSLVVVDTNIEKCFFYEGGVPPQEDIHTGWPIVNFKGTPVNLRRYSEMPGLVSCVFADGEAYGWVTACNPAKGLLIGYLWKTDDYPWLVLWHGMKDGVHTALGLEFGTTGVGLTFKEHLKVPEVSGRPVYEYIDAGQTIEKSYIAFLSRIPEDYGGVENISFHEGVLVISERDSLFAKDIVLKTK